MVVTKNKKYERTTKCSFHSGVWLCSICIFSHYFSPLPEVHLSEKRELALLFFVGSKIVNSDGIDFSSKNSVSGFAQLKW